MKYFLHRMTYIFNQYKVKTTIVLHTYKIHASNHVTQRHYYHMYINTLRTQKSRYEELDRFAFPWLLIADKSFYLLMIIF